MDLHSTWPCVVEAAQFLSAPRCCAMQAWIAEGAVGIYPFDPADVADMLPLMERDTQPPRADMARADASLLWVAGEIGLTTILSLDVRDFHHCRLPDGRGFQLL